MSLQNEPPIPGRSPTTEDTRGEFARRFGSIAPGGWRVYKSGITAAEALTDVNRGVVLAESSVVEFCVIRPPGVTAFEVQAGRLIRMSSGDSPSKGFELTHKHIDYVEGGITEESWIGSIDVARDGVWLIVSDVTGDADTQIADSAGVRAIDKPHNTDGVPNGFLVLYRRRA